MYLLTKRERRVSLPVTKVGVNTFDLEEKDDDVMMALKEGGEQRSHVPGVTKVGVSVRVLEQRGDKWSVTMTRRQVEGGLARHHYIISRCVIVSCSPVLIGPAG